MMIAAIIILVSVLGIYAFQREQAKDLELNNIADRISGTIDNFNSLSGESKINVTFERGKEGTYVKPTVNGERYEIVITRIKVFVTLEERRAVSNLIAPIHLWAPQSNIYNQWQIEENDGDHKILEFMSGEDFKVERKLLEIDQENEYRTFVYV